MSYKQPEVRENEGKEGKERIGGRSSDSSIWSSGRVANSCKNQSWNSNSNSNANVNANANTRYGFSTTQAAVKGTGTGTGTGMSVGSTSFSGPPTSWASRSTSSSPSSALTPSTASASSSWRRPQGTQQQQQQGQQVRYLDRRPGKAVAEAEVVDRRALPPSRNVTRFMQPQPQPQSHHLNQPGHHHSAQHNIASTKNTVKSSGGASSSSMWASSSSSSSSLSPSLNPSTAVSSAPRSSVDYNPPRYPNQHQYQTQTPNASASPLNTNKNKNKNINYNDTRRFLSSDPSDLRTRRVDHPAFISDPAPSTRKSASASPNTSARTRGSLLGLSGGNSSKGEGESEIDILKPNTEIADEDKPKTPTLTSEEGIQRLKEEDREMEMLGTVSRSGGWGEDDEDGDALKNQQIQERFWAYIGRRLHRWHLKFTPPPADSTIHSNLPHPTPLPLSTPAHESLTSILLLFRKLREGILASSRVDGFAIHVYEISALYAIRAGERGQINSCLSVLVEGGMYGKYERRLLQQQVGLRNSAEDVTESTDLLAGALADSEKNENHDQTVSQTVLEHGKSGKTGHSDVNASLQSRKTYFASLLLLYQLTNQDSSSSSSQFWSTWKRLVFSQTKTRRSSATPDNSSSDLAALGSSFHESHIISPPSFVDRNSPFIRICSLAHRAITTPEPLLYHALLRITNSSSFPSYPSDSRSLVPMHSPPTWPYHSIILQFAQERLREKTWEILKKAYGKETSLGWVRELLNSVEVRESNDVSTGGSEEKAGERTEEAVRRIKRDERVRKELGLPSNTPDPASISSPSEETANANAGNGQVEIMYEDLKVDGSPPATADAQKRGDDDDDFNEWTRSADVSHPVLNGDENGKGDVDPLINWIHSKGGQVIDLDSRIHKNTNTHQSRCKVFFTATCPSSSK